MTQNINIKMTPSGTLTGSSAVPTLNKQGPADQSGNLGSVLATAAYYLSEIEAAIAGTFNLSKTTDDSAVMQAQRNLAQQKLQETISQAKEIQKEQEERDSMNPIEKAFEVVASVLLSAFALMTGQVEVAVLMTTMTVMNETGATNKIIGDSLGATLGLLAVTTALSFGVGSMAAVDKVVQDEAEQAAKSFLSKAVDAITPRLSVALTIQNDIQMLLSTNAMQNIAKAAGLNKEELAILTGILMAISILSAVGTGNAMSNANKVEEGAENGLRATIKRYIGELNLNNPKLLFAMGALQRAFSLGNEGMQIAQGAIELKQADLNKKMIDNYALIDLIQTLMNIASDGMSNSQKQVATLLQGHQDGVRTISSWLDGQREFTQVLTSASPV